MKMIRVSLFTAAVMLVAVFLFTATMFGQNRAAANGSRQPARVAAPSSLVVENFEYPAATALTSAGWTAHSVPGTNPLTVTEPGLTYSGWPSAGNAVSMTTSGEDAHRTFPVQTSGSVYAGILVNLSEASLDATGGYFFHLGPSPIGTTFRGRIFVRKDAMNNVSFGFTKASTSTPADIVYTPFTYALNTTYLMIVKYTIVDGATNDTASLFINPALGGAEPAATLVATDIGASDINPGAFALRQGSVATSPTARVDGIRIATSWADLLTAPPATVVDFDGDGKTDYAVARNIGGVNGQLRWFYNLNAGGPTVALDWGLDNDVLTPADYDGDGKTDLSVWRPGPALTAAFYILNSATSTVRIEQFGQNDDNPTVVRDYNGDGKADVAVYRPGVQGTWYYRSDVAGPVTYVLWGTTNDIPVPGDYDGDGKGDFVIVRNNGGQSQYWMSRTTAGFAVSEFGPYPTSGMGAYVPGDFDGDGKTDFAFADGTGATGVFYYLPSSGGSTVTIFGGNPSTDELVPGDYDGDRKTDIAIWRDGTFWVRNSSTGAWTNFALGSAGDKPVAAYFDF